MLGVIVPLVGLTTLVVACEFCSPQAAIAAQPLEPKVPATVRHWGPVAVGGTGPDGARGLVQVEQ